MLVNRAVESLEMCGSSFYAEVLQNGSPSPLQRTKQSSLGRPDTRLLVDAGEVSTLIRMEVITLQSGSSGNCVYVETDGVRLLFDAGISGNKAQQRLSHHGKDIRDVDALIISHDHRDHTASMGIFQRKFGMPIYVTKRTYAETKRRMKLGRLHDVRHFCSGDTMWFGRVSVESIRTPHDAVDGVAFVVDNSQHRFGVLTDLGHVFSELESVMPTLDAVLIESNYCPRMLDDGPYPAFLKNRISGPAGHISNVEAAELLKRAGSERLNWACLAHLSDENNDPAVALETHQQVLGSAFRLICADRQAVSPLMHVSEFDEETFAPPIAASASKLPHDNAMVTTSIDQATTTKKSSQSQFDFTL
ncbi:MAG: MBL fold metallo-hydrolase [Pirellulaceae bacterium]|nr:MBL fold metallo-hydrolase [Pirellulaceae bacterium]